MLEFLTPIWYVKAVTARAVHRRIRSVLERTIAMDPRNDNPCYRVLPVLGPQNDIVTHRPALPHKNVAAAVEAVRASGPGSRHQAGVRVSPDHGGAVGGSQTRHVGRDHTADRVWTISALRMKAKREHRVPLCGPALEIPDAARTLGDGTPLVFPMRSGKAVAASTPPKMLQYHRIAAVAHGFPSSFRD